MERINKLMTVKAQAMYRHQRKGGGMSENQFIDKRICSHTISRFAPPPGRPDVMNELRFDDSNQETHIQRDQSGAKLHPTTSVLA
jgi:hypothetical protein